MKKFICFLSVLALVLLSVPTNTLKVYAAETHTVTFDFKEQSLTNVIKTVEHGSLVERPVDPVVNGKIFTGWYKTDGSAFDFNTPIVEDMTLNAEWNVGGASNPNLPTGELMYAFDDIGYQTIFTSGAANAYATCQPISALVLAAENDVITPVTASSLSENYSSGVIDLPRLKSGYYYKLSGDAVGTYGLSVERTTYPTLSWTSPLAKDAEVTLGVYYKAENNVMYTTTLHFNSALDAISSSFGDITSSMIVPFISDASTIETYTGEVFGYNPALHEFGLITQESITFVNCPYKEEVITAWDNVTLIPNTGVTNTHVFNNYWYEPQLEGGSATSTVTANVDEYVYRMYDKDVDSTLLIVGTDMSGVNINNNLSHIVSVHNTNAKHEPYSNDLHGAYLLVSEGVLDLHSVVNTKLESYEDLTKVPTNPRKTLTVDNVEYKKLLEAFGPLSAGSLALTVLQLAEHLDINTELSDDIYVKYTGKDDVKTAVYETALGYFGYNAGTGLINFKAADSLATINYWAANLETGAKELKNTVTVNLKNPSIDYLFDYGNSLYQTSSWYIDENYTTEFNVTTWLASVKNGDTLNLYCKPIYVGGSYKVTFYNDATESSSEATFETRYKPTLPDVPERTGYLFKNWCIVDTVASTTGTPYTSESFTPSKDSTYIFKTFWDIQGIIKEVKTTKTEYYTGDSIDKSKIIVTVQTDNNGTVKTLRSSEFSISPSKIEHDGTNQILVTYNATGATGTFTVTGKPVEATKISAKYKGEALKVGSTIDEDDFEVTVHYNNGDKKKAETFQYTPKTVRSTGVNTIKVTYGELSTTCSVKGLSATSGDVGGNDKTLSYISAIYNGPEPYVGDILAKSYFRVYAHYSDGSKVALASSNFTISPSTLSKEGYNVITISYSGKTCSMSISARYKSTITNPGSSTGTTGGGSGSGSSSSNTSTGSSNSSNSSNSNSGSNSSGNNSSEENKGDPSTGAGVPNSNKGTSKSYLNGNNILESFPSSSTGATVKNDVDILKEIQSAGASASRISVQLYNGASDNYITSEMLKLLKKKSLILEVDMIDPETKSDVLANWEVTGQALDNTDFTLNPNIVFEEKDKGTEKVMFISVNPAEYPKGMRVIARPDLGYYNNGEVVRAYEVNNVGSNSTLYSTFKWSDESSELPLDIYESHYYALSNASQVYTTGTSLLDKVEVSIPNNIMDSTSDDTLDDFFEESSSDEEVEFDWGDDSELITPEPEEPVAKKSPLPLILVGLVVVIIAVGGVFIFLKVKGGTKPRITFDVDEDTLDEDEFVDEGINLDTEDEDLI